MLAKRVFFQGKEILASNVNLRIRRIRGYGWVTALHGTESWTTEVQGKRSLKRFKGGALRNVKRQSDK